MTTLYANLTPALPTPSDSRCILSAKIASQRMAPLWPLKHFVAANPFVGLTKKTFSRGYYREKWESGQIGEPDLRQALRHAASHLFEATDPPIKTWSPELLVQWLDHPSQPPQEILSIAEAVDRAHGSNWSANIVESISQFCSTYYDQGQSAWRQPWREMPLYAAWREMASRDATMEVIGCRGFRAQIARLPDEPAESIASSVQTLAISETLLDDYLHRLLMTIRGWAGHVQYLARDNAMRSHEDDSMLHLLAIRLAYETALFKRFDTPSLSGFWPTHNDAFSGLRDVTSKYLWQLADEKAWLRQISPQLALNRRRAPAVAPAAVQAVFCIDVRSEVFRRSLEAVSPNIDTAGFAGFFGLPLEFIPFGQNHGRAQCPVLLKPAFKVRETLKQTDAHGRSDALKRLRLGKRTAYAWNSFKTSAISCFSFVEAAGMAFGPRLWIDSFALGPSCKRAARSRGPELTREHGCTPGTGISLEDQFKLALAALTNMGLTKNFARLVLLCGHGSDTVNNPYGSALDCGACGGHAGDANARVGAAILNSSEVRRLLIARGIEIPKDTLFLAALHHTTTDHVTLYDVENVPSTHQQDLQQLQSWLEQAGSVARRERAPLLGLIGSEARLDRLIERRSLDWSEVRPEWGLAGNAAFIAAPRLRTRGVNLRGRVFLHDYNFQTDPENSVLESIMTAPMIVANWINLQYFASTANNVVYGSGNKVTHNVVGILGVCQGNGGDLQTGLPLQSVHDGTRWIHEPLRLHVFLEAPRHCIEAVLVKNPTVRLLVENGWLILFALEKEGEDQFLCLPNMTWEPVADSLACEPGVSGLSCDHTAMSAGIKSQEVSSR